MRSALRAALVLVAVSVLSIGCHSHSTGTKMNEANLNQIQKGKTTRAEMIQWFGTPAHNGRDQDGQAMSTWVYSQTDAKVKGTTFIPYAGAFMGGSTAKTETQTLTAWFDTNGIVQRYNMSDSAQNMDHSSNPFGGGTTVTNQPTGSAAK